MIRQLKLFLVVFSFLCLKGVVAQTALPAESLKIPIVNYGEMQAQYFDVQGDSTIILNFWASWCVPCRLEIPYFEQLQKEFLTKKVRIVLISIDNDEDIERKLKPYLRARPINLEVVLLQDKISPTQLIPLICPNWSGTIPLTVVMNQTDGSIFETSFVSYEQLKNAVLPFIKQ